MDTAAAIHSRILSRVDRATLQRHCSAVFNDELTDIQSQLREVLAAYARLQEVREAVSSLHADGLNFASLAPTIASTTQTNAALASRLHEIKVMLPAQSLPDGEPLQQDATAPPQPKTKRKRSEMSSRVDPPPQSPKKLKEESSVAVAAGESRAALMQTPWSVGDGNSVVDASPPANNASVPKPIEDPIVTQIKQLMSTTSRLQSMQKEAQAAERPRILTAYTSLIKDVAGLEPSAVAAVEVSSLLSSLTGQIIRICRRGQHDNQLMHQCIKIEHTLRHQIKSNPGLETLRPSQQQLTKIVQAQTASTWEIATRDAEAVAQRFSIEKDVIAFAVMKAFTDSVCSIFHRVATDSTMEVTKIGANHCNNVLANIVRIFSKPYIDATYLPLLESVLQAVDQVPMLNHPTLKFIQKRRQDLSTTLQNIQTVSSVEKPVVDTVTKTTSTAKKPTNSEAKVEALREEITTAVTEVRTWNDNIFSMKQFDAVAKVVGKAVNSRRSKSWDPSDKAMLLECIDLLSTRVTAIKKNEHRQPREQLVIQWKKALK